MSKCNKIQIQPDATGCDMTAVRPYDVIGTHRKFAIREFDVQSIRCGLVSTYLNRAYFIVG